MENSIFHAEYVENAETYRTLVKRRFALPIASRVLRRKKTFGIVTENVYNNGGLNVEVVKDMCTFVL